MSLPLPPDAKGLRVHVKTSDKGWILSRIAGELAKRLPYVTVGPKADPTAPVQYYINFNEHSARISPLEFAWFTHIENGEEGRRFFATAKQVDVSVCHAARYAQELRKVGIGRVVVIPPGVDLERYAPRVKIGVVGRTYPSGRKGEDLIREVFDLPGIEWHFTGEGWPAPARLIKDEDMPAFYNAMDYILVASLYEGGPMCVVEALACGTPVIAPPVGWVSDFPHIEYRTGDATDLRRVLGDLVQQRLQLRRSVEHLSWDHFARKHHELFVKSFCARRDQMAV